MLQQRHSDVGTQKAYLTYNYYLQKFEIALNTIIILFSYNMYMKSFCILNFHTYL